MGELIKIQERDGCKAVSARELYSFLNVETRFNDWCNRMFDYGFQEDTDFYSILSKNSRGRPSVDYALTIECAKEIAMIQRTPRGKQARQYFIECEKKLKQAVKPLSTLEILKKNIQLYEEQQMEIDEVKKDISYLKATTQNRPDYFTVVGYATLNNINVGLKLAAKLGQKASRVCKEKGYPIEKLPDPRFGHIGVYPKHVLKQVFNSAL